ncbi:MAG: peroxiredoxin [Trueperaceae bacterium]
MSELTNGDPAPDFRGESTDGPVSLSDYRGSWLVLYVYPADFTPGCTTEACDFRDALPDLDAKVLGVSPDEVDKHRAFREEHGLPFPLLADPDHAVAKTYGAYGTKTAYGKQVTGILRSTFLIAPDGTLAEAMRNVRAKGHVDRVRTRLEALRG